MQKTYYNLNEEHEQLILDCTDESCDTIIIKRDTCDYHIFDSLRYLYIDYVDSLSEIGRIQIDDYRDMNFAKIDSAQKISFGVIDSLYEIAMGDVDTYRSEAITQVEDMQSGFTEWKDSVVLALNLRADSIERPVLYMYDNFLVTSEDTVIQNISGLTSLIIYGHSTMCDSAYATARVEVNGSSNYVLNGGYLSNFDFPSSLDGKTLVVMKISVEDIETIELIWEGNDCYHEETGEDRNIFIEKFSINGVVVPADKISMTGSVYPENGYPYAMMYDGTIKITL